MRRAGVDPAWTGWDLRQQQLRQAAVRPTQPARRRLTQMGCARRQVARRVDPLCRGFARGSRRRADRGLVSPGPRVGSLPVSRPRRAGVEATAPRPARASKRPEGETMPTPTSSSQRHGDEAALFIELHPSLGWPSPSGGWSEPPGRRCKMRARSRSVAVALPARPHAVYPWLLRTGSAKRKSSTNANAASCRCLSARTAR